MHKKLAFLLVLVVFSVTLSGCADKKSAVRKAADAYVNGDTAATSTKTDGIAQSTADKPANIQNNNQSAQTMTDITKPQAVIDQKKSYSAILHTDKGDIEVALTAKETPITANNFVWLAKNKFYDNTIFHRVIKGFMIQGGDPKGDGTGGPGYQFDDEKFTGEYTRGTIAMANAGPNTNGSQFFIMHADYPLPKNYVIFGHVTKGLDVVDKIADSPVKMSISGEPSQPIDPTKVKSVEIIEK